MRVSQLLWFQVPLSFVHQTEINFGTWRIIDWWWHLVKKITPKKFFAGFSFFFVYYFCCYIFYVRTARFQFCSFRGYAKLFFIIFLRKIKVKKSCTIMILFFSQFSFYFSSSFCKLRSLCVWFIVFWFNMSKQNTF